MKTNFGTAQLYFHTYGYKKASGEFPRSLDSDKRQTSKMPCISSVAHSLNARIFNKKQPFLCNILFAARGTLKNIIPKWACEIGFLFICNLLSIDTVFSKVIHHRNIHPFV